MNSLPPLFAPPPWANRDFPRASLRLTRGRSLRAARGPLLLTTGTEGLVSYVMSISPLLGQPKNLMCRCLDTGGQRVNP
jgi:hypothetical protein